jgi:DNA invertase Pin-like site-specific DNA recombinase
MRAAIYTRLSLDKDGESTSTQDQEAECRELVQRQGWTVQGVYTDNDISVDTGKARPAYRRMLTAVAAGEVDVIVSWATDRLYRRVESLGELILAEPEGLIDLESPILAEPEDVDRQLEELGEASVDDPFARRVPASFKRSGRRWLLS